MTFRVFVDSPLASEVTLNNCSRAPKPGDRFKVTFFDSVIDFGTVVKAEPVSDEELRSQPVVTPSYLSPKRQESSWIESRET